MTLYPLMSHMDIVVLMINFRMVDENANKTIFVELFQCNRWHKQLVIRKKLDQNLCKELSILNHKCALHLCAVSKHL